MGGRRLYIAVRGSFYGLPSIVGEDEEFAELYCRHNGRDSVPPSLVDRTDT